MQRIAKLYHIYTYINTKGQYLLTNIKTIQYEFHILTHPHRYIHIYIYIFVYYTYIHIYIDTHIHTDIHTHIQGRTYEALYIYR